MFNFAKNARRIGRMEWRANGTEADEKKTDAVEIQACLNKTKTVVFLNGSDGVISKKGK